MSSLDFDTQQGQAEQNKQTGLEQAQSGANPGQPLSRIPGLPPTAMAMQMQSLNDEYSRQQQQRMGGGMNAFGAGAGGMGAYGSGAGQGDLVNADWGRSSLSDLAERMASGYGLNFTPGSLVDENGQFLMNPDQLVGEGGDLSDTAAYMNLIAQGINERQTEMAQDKATASLQAGAGLLQQRGRGSLAALQSNFYSQMAANYSNPNLLPEQQDFSFWIQKDQMDEAELDRDGGGGDGAPGKTQPDPYNPGGGTVTGPSGRGDKVTDGPNAGKCPEYTYDPIAQTTTITWVEC